MTFRGFDEQEQLVMQKVLHNGHSMTAAREALRSFRRAARMQGDQESQRRCYLTLLQKVTETNSVAGQEVN